MSYTPDSITLQDGYCNPIMRGVSQVNDPSNTTFMTTPTGVLQSLFDPYNRSLAEYIVQESAGNIRSIRVKRIQRGTISDAITGTTCDATTTSGYTEQQIVLNQEPCTVSFNVTLEQLEQYCSELLIFERTGDMSGLSTFRVFNEMIMSKMHALRLCINTRITAMILANAGINVTTGVNTPSTLTMLDGVTGAKIELGLQDLVQDLENNEMMQPIAVGSGVFSRFNTSLMYGCCNFGGLDWAAMADASPYKFYFDKQVGVAAGDPNEFLILAPGAVQFIYANRSIIPSRQTAQRHGTTEFGLLPDPYVPGLVYDLAIKQNDCATGEYDPSWTIFISSLFDLAYIPEDAFSADDDLFGWNGIIRYVAATS